MSARLRDLIKVVRAAKTAQDEREIISKECAAIRTSFKEEEADNRPRNVAKLLYIHMMGYPTHFGQMECLKLIVSPQYSDKRIGYLALMLLLDERQEVLMLVTNSLKMDLMHVNQYVVGLALAALGNISSEGMARDCAPEVEKLLNSQNPYIRKKAALCAIRILRKVPDLLENFVPKVRALLSEKDHGVLLTGVSLMIEMCRIQPSVAQDFKKMVPSLVKILKSVVSYGYSPEYDVSGITDPFLQVKILRVLRLLGEDDATASDQMNDLLAQIATNTDPLKNVGNAILYECVNTIMSIKSEDGLRVLAVNILGRFLSNRDNNIRYVALNTLCKVVSIDTDAVQRHRNTIVDCLKDNDISIRRRALELIYSLVNESNVRVLVRELINFLLVADVEFRSDLTAKLCMVTEKFAPTPRWRIDTILKVMSIAGAYVPDVVASNLVALISSGGADLHTYAVQKMYLALSEDITQQSLVQVAVWCLGEFGELLLRSTAISLEDAGSQTLSVSESDVTALLSKILRAPTSKTSTKRYVLTAIVKLTARFSPQAQQQLKALLLEFKQHLNVELQQRSIEFAQIASLDNIKPTLLARMPAPEIKHDAGAVAAPATPSVTSPLGIPSTGGVDLLDLMDLNLSAPAPTGAAPVAANPLAALGLGAPAPTAAPVSGNDLLAELFGPSAPATTPAPAAMTPALGVPLTPATAPAATPSFATLNPSAPLTPVPAGMDGSLLTPLSGVGQTWPPINVLDAPEDGLSVVFEVSKPQPQNPQFTLIVATFTNRGSMSLTDFEMKCAVPNYLKLVLLPASNTLIAPNNSVKVTQQIKIANSAHGQKPVKLKLRFDYKVGGSPRTREIPPLDLPAGV
eukprot:TRINITY_DN2423_c0_g1_i1.p1 TRINITY_DN2423_c0_g1~~TRINITY_DN2423_c0_g1_i1.p1  ORF type:complete len:858 (-),score=269.36 TRINITY_DN2423_c0_g1_i1:65-2638(-)